MLYITLIDGHSEFDLVWHVGSPVPDIFQPIKSSEPRRLTAIQADGDELAHLKNMKGAALDLLIKYQDISSTKHVGVWTGCWAGMIYGLMLAQNAVTNIT